jgi:hypothetical protein
MTKIRKIDSKMVRGTTNLYKGVPQTTDTEGAANKLYREAMFQKEIINWNTNYVGKKRSNGDDIIEAMANVKFNTGTVIVQLYHQDFIPESNVVIGDDNKIQAWRFAPPLIDVRRHPTDPESLAVNPIPTVFKGVIVGLSDDIRFNYLLRKEQMEKIGMDVSDFIIPEVGDIIYMTFFLTKDTRFYINKQEKELDIVITPTNYTIENFDYTFKVSEFNIESIVKRDKVELVSDYKYKYASLINQVNDPEDIHKIFTVNENWEV